MLEETAGQDGGAPRRPGTKNVSAYFSAVCTPALAEALQRVRSSASSDLVSPPKAATRPTSLARALHETAVRARDGAAVEKGSQTTGKGATAGRVTMDQIREIAEQKMQDLNANDLDAACQMVIGSARSMGLEVVE